MCQIGLELSQLLARLFCTFAIFNVRESSVPFNNGSMLVPKWDTTHQKPAIFPVRGAKVPRLVFEKLPGRNRDAPLLGMARKIFAMDRTLPTDARTLLDRKPGVFGPALIHKCGGAVRQRSESHRRNCFHNVPQTLFLTLESMNAPSIKCPKQCNKDGDARQSKPVSLIVSRGDVQSDRSFWPVPQPLAVAGDKPESIGTGPKVRVNGFSRCNRLAPATVETVEEISKANPPGHREAQPRVLKCDSHGRWRNPNGGGEFCGVVIRGDRLDVRQRGS